MALQVKHLRKRKFMRLYSGFIENYSSSTKQIASGMITSYSPSNTDVIILCASPKDTSGSADNVKVWVEWSAGVWNVYVSDANYTGDIAFQVIAP